MGCREIAFEKEITVEKIALLLLVGATLLSANVAAEETAAHEHARSAG